MTTAKIVLPNFYKLILYTQDNQQITTKDERLLTPSSFGSYLSFEILNTTDGKFKLRTREVEGGVYVGYSDEGLYLMRSPLEADQFEIHLNTTDNTFALLSSTSTRVKSTGNVVYVSLNPPLKI